MKKTLLFLLMAVLLPLTAGAAYRTFQVNGIYYAQMEQEDQFVSVIADPSETSPTKYSGDIVIPASVTYGGKTYPVTKIGKWSFWECTGLKSVVLPEGITTIENSSFYGCTQLKGITLPSTLMWINGTDDSYSRGAFENCTGLKSIYFPATMTYLGVWSANIGDGAFRGCTGLKVIYLAGNETTIGYYDAFSGCTGAEAVVINNPAPYDGPVVGRVFEGMLNTTALVVPDGTGTAFKTDSNWGQFQHIYEHSSYSKAFAVLTAGIGGTLTYSSEDIWRATKVYGVTKGQSVTVTITPDEGHQLLRLLKDGQDVTAQVSGGKYTVQNVQQDFTLEAVFEEGTTPGPQPGGGGTAKLSIEPFSIKDGEPAVDIAGRTTWKKHTLTVTTADGHFMLYSASNATLSGTSGAIISVKLTAGSTFGGGNIVLTGQLLNTPAPVTSAPADYVYTLEGNQQPQLELKLMEVCNAVDGVVHSNDIKFWFHVFNSSDDFFNGYIYLNISRQVNGSWETYRSGEKYNASIASGGTCGDNFVFFFWNYDDGKYKYELSYAKDDSEARTNLGSMEFEVNNHSAWRSILFLWHDMQTFCDNTDLDFTSVEGLKAYTAGGFDTATGEALMMRVGSVPAYEGLLLVGESFHCYLVPRQSSSTIYVNMLKGYYSEGGTGTSLSATEDGYSNYTFDGWSKTFKAISGSGYVNGKEAYLQIPASAASSRQAITLKFDDTSGISDMVTESQPFDVYSLSGALVRHQVTTLKGLPRGVYIVGGRKVVVK